MRKHVAVEEAQQRDRSSASLCIRGAAIELSANTTAKRRWYSNDAGKTIEFDRLDVERGAPVPHQRQQPGPGRRIDRRPALKVNVCEDFLRTRGDFEGFPAKGPREFDASDVLDVLDEIDPDLDLDGVYEEFFGRHYDALYSYS